jgi:hypothetical protein
MFAVVVIAMRDALPLVLAIGTEQRCTLGDRMMASYFTFCAAYAIAIFAIVSNSPDGWWPPGSERSKRMTSSRVGSAFHPLFVPLRPEALTAAAAEAKAMA